MSTLLYTPLTAADLGDEEAFNSRFGLIVSKLNASLDSDHFLAGSVTRAKIGQGAVTAAKRDNTFTWITPTLGTSWANWTDATYGGPQYYKDPRGTVRIRGLVYRPSGTNTTIFNLPAGYRPVKRLLFPIVTAGISSRIDVDVNGDVIWIAGQSPANWHSLCNIQFKAVQ